MAMAMTKWLRCGLAITTVLVSGCAAGIEMLVTTDGAGGSGLMLTIDLGVAVASNDTNQLQLATATGVAPDFNRATFVPIELELAYLSPDAFIDGIGFRVGASWMHLANPGRGPTTTPAATSDDFGALGIAWTLTGVYNADDYHSVKTYESIGVTVAAGYRFPYGAGDGHLMLGVGPRWNIQFSGH